MTQPVKVEIVQTIDDTTELDELLWQTLWQPFGFPRNVRHKFMVQGKEIELCAKINGRIVGGLVAVWTNNKELELRHLAVASLFQRAGVGTVLVAELVRIASSQNCMRVRTSARNTSVGFFCKMGFEKTEKSPPEHPVFLKHGIRFEIMERDVEQAAARNALTRVRAP